MTLAEQRTCPRCGKAFTWTTAAPRQRYCANRCRSAYNRNPARYANGPIPPPASSTTMASGTTSTPGGTVSATGTMPGDGTTTVRPCPHCGEPVTAITWIVPPAAAAVTTPSPVAPTHRNGP